MQVDYLFVPWKNVTVDADWLMSSLLNISGVAYKADDKGSSMGYKQMLIK